MYKVGSVEIARIVEVEALAWPSQMTVGLAPEQVLQHDWMKPYSDDEGQLLLSFHAFLVRTNGKIILIDPCLGARRQLPAPVFSDLDRTFADNLAAEGVALEDVDMVVCTHLHFDHIGWNTQYVNGEWIPTFPNARYIYSSRDFEYAREHARNTRVDASCFSDSILPPFDAGLVELIDPESGFQVGDDVSVISTPGHSSGHFSVLINSGGRSAVITGDVLHSPVECAHPDQRRESDADPDLAITTRRKLLERVADKPILVFGTHFPPPTGGFVTSSGDTWRFDPAPEHDATVRASVG